MNNGLIGEKSCHSQDIFYNTSTATWAKVFLEFLFERITCLSINNREGRGGGKTRSYFADIVYVVSYLK